MVKSRQSVPCTVLDFGARPDGEMDNSEAFGKFIDVLLERGGGTLFVPDGIYGLGEPLSLRPGVSLQLTPGATLRAMDGFKGEAVVETRVADEFYEDQSIRGGTIDGNKQELIGVRVQKANRVFIGDMLIQNALAKGLHIGVDGHYYEVSVANVRCRVAPGVKAAPGSIGLHYDKCGDSFISSVVVIGYETGVRSDKAANDFHLVHVWNYSDNCPLVTCFHCNGENDSYSQCYADSPINGDKVGYGFYVEQVFNRIIGCRVYCNDFATPDKVIGVYVAETGKHGTYMANHFMAEKGHAMHKTFDGALDDACMTGNSHQYPLRD